MQNGWVQSSEAWRRATVTADTIIRTGPGEVRGARCTVSSSLVGAFYDGTDTNGVRLTENISLSAGTVVDLVGQVFTTGLYFELVSGTGTVNVFVR